MRLPNFAVMLVMLCAANFAHAGEPPAEPILRIDPGEHAAAIKSIATDKAGRWLITASDDKTARVWDLSDGRLISTLRFAIGSGNEGRLNAATLSPDGQIVALGGWIRLGYEGADMNNNVLLFDRATGRLLRRLTGLPQSITHLAFSPDGRSLVVMLAGSKGLRVFSIADGHLIGEDRDYGRDSYSAHFSTDGRLVTTCYDRLLRLYRFDGTNLTLLARHFAPGGNQPFEARFSPDGKRIAVGFSDTAAVNVLDAIDLSFLYAADTAGVNNGLTHVGWSQDSKILYAAGRADKKTDTGWQSYIRRWPNEGKGAPIDWLVATNSLAGLVALSNGRLVFGSHDPSWGVLLADGARQVLHTPMLADFRDNGLGFFLSTGGEKVGFSHARAGKSPAVFDVSTRAFLKVDTTGLIRPSYAGEGMEFSLDFLFGDTAPPTLNGSYLKLQQHETARSLAILPKGVGFVLGTNWNLRAFERSGSPRWEQPAPGEVWGVNASADGRFIVAAYGDGTIRWYRASDGVEQLAFFPHADKKRWIMWTPEGYYDASPGGEDLIGWHLNQGKDKEARFIPSGQLYDVFFRPDIVQAKFRGDDISGLITITAAQALKYPPPVLSFTKVPSTTKQNLEQVCYKAVATGGGIGEVRLFQNGKLIKSDGFYRESVAKADTSFKLAAMDSAAVSRALKLTKTAQKAEPPMVSNSKGNEFEECQEVETIPGDNEISVAAFNANNTVQSSLETSHFTSNRKPEAPHLYVLGIGIDKYTASENNLSYAVKDATDFRGMIQDKAKGLYKENNIHIEGLSDAAATKAGIQQAIAAISAKVKPWDSFILFVASHGYLQDNQYYIVTADFNGTIDTANMISSNEIVGMSKNIKSLSQLLIFDTCHAGGVDNIIGGLYDARMSVMAKKMGLHIYASAGSTQTALDGYKGNGLFTHALLNSMKANTTDTNHDKEVSVAELGESAKQETMAISKQLGFPQSPNIINFGKDNVLFGVQ